MNCNTPTNLPCRFVNLNMTDTDKQIFFLGIGGIGMSALARYFRHEGYTVAGYDRTPSDLTHALESEGISVFYDDNVNLLPFAPDNLPVVWTPEIGRAHV